ncbi:MAG: rhomboid family intramembrane serine protease [Myxococcota bacterium]|nr:rhomboid family intramembrane serine protease [Myxococcota bacterium]
MRASGLPRLPDGLTRLPLVCLTVSAVWLLVAAVVGLGFGSQASLAEQRVRAAVDYAIQNPVVEVPPRLVPAVRAVMPSFDSNEMFAFLRDADNAGTQAEFDVLVAAAFETLDAHPHRVLGVVPASLSPHTFATHWWVHAGALHLLATLVVWLLAAPLLERLWGRRVFAGTLLTAGLFSGATFAVVHGGADRALVGASALVAAVVAAVVVRFRSEEVDLLGWLDGVVEAELSVPAWGLAPVWAGYVALVWWVVPGTHPGGLENAVGATAQASGALLGALAGFAIQRAGWEERFGSPPSRPARSAAARFDLDRVRDLRARGEVDRAYAMLEAEVARSARNRDVVSTFWEMSIERSEPERAATAMQRLVREELRRGAEEVAVAQWRELSEHLPTQRLDPQTLLKLVPIVHRVDGDESAVVSLQQLLDAEDGAIGGPGLVRAAKLGESLAPELALHAAQRALAGGDLPEGPRAEIEELSRRLSPTPADDVGFVEPEEKPPEPAPDVFFEESDRSDFGAVDDLSAPDEHFPRGAVCEARPRALGDDGLDLEVEGQGVVLLGWSRLRGLAAAGVHGLGPKPVVLVDLVIDGAGSEQPLRILRLRSDKFSPRRFFPEARGPLSALRSLVRHVLTGSGARPLPDAASGALEPVRIFDSVDEYEEQVLRPLAAEWG